MKKKITSKPSSRQGHNMVGQVSGDTCDQPARRGQLKSPPPKLFDGGKRTFREVFNLIGTHPKEFKKLHKETKDYLWKKAWEDFDRQYKKYWLKRLKMELNESDYSDWVKGIYFNYFSEQLGGIITRMREKGFDSFIDYIRYVNKKYEDMPYHNPPIFLERSKQYHRMRIVTWICCECGLPREFDNNKTLCKDCLKKANKRSKKLRNKRKAGGLCCQCGIIFKGKHSRCDKCNEKHNAYMKEYRKIDDQTGVHHSSDNLKNSK